MTSHNGLERAVQHGVQSNTHHYGLGGAQREVTIAQNGVQAGAM